MYKEWTIEDVKSEIHKLEHKSKFYLDSDVEIKINPRFKRTLAYCRYKHENKLTKIESLEFNKKLLDGTVNEDEVLDTIIHEFAHAYTDYNKPDDRFYEEDDHSQEWKQNAVKLGCSGEVYYLGDEFKYEIPYNKTLIIRCKKCGQIYHTCDMVLGQEIVNYYHCTHKVNGKTCKGKFEVLEDIATDEKRLKCIKRYIKDELIGNRHGELMECNGTNFRLLHIKNSGIVNFRISYKDNVFKVQVTNKLEKIADDEIKERYKIVINDINKYLKNKDLFKFIDNLKFEHKGEDKYEFSFPLNIKNINLAEI